MLWKARGGLDGRWERLCEKAHVAKRQHAKYSAGKGMRKSAEIMLTKRNMASAATSRGYDKTCEEMRGGRGNSMLPIVNMPG